MNQFEKNVMASRFKRWQKKLHDGTLMQFRSRTKNRDFIGFSAKITSPNGRMISIPLIDVPTPKDAEIFAWERFVEGEK